MASMIKPTEDEYVRTPPKWRRPEEVMRLHKDKMKKRALQARLSANLSNSLDNSDSQQDKFSILKRNRNPFKLATENGLKKQKLQSDVADETSADGTLFQIVNFSQNSLSQSQSDEHNATFTNALNKLMTSSSVLVETEKLSTIIESLPVDWTLRTKVRLISTNPFPWNQKVKTCEEASGITGFVRCIDIASKDVDRCSYNLDTSPNARFHQCCLHWQHPSIPWLELYPRIGTKSSSTTAVSLLPFKDAIYKDWIQSFTSLFQMVRAKLCPYFYLLSNTFVCVFRAAGIANYSEINALLTPTSRGFRQLLKDEDIEFSMPLKRNNENSSSNGNSMYNEDTGYESLDLPFGSSELEEDTASNKNTDNVEEEEETEKWLQNMGVEEAEIKRFSSSQQDVLMTKERQIDNCPESLISVEGIEAQALFNFLVNCKSTIPSTGQFAGVPPTLIAPVAFTGSTLKSLKVRESVVKMNEKCYHSMEIKGPILPHTIHDLCNLLKNSKVDKFSLTFADVEVSKSFSSASSRQIELATVSALNKTPSANYAFEQQNLSDCGLKPTILATLCSCNIKQFDSVKYCDSQYICN